MTPAPLFPTAPNTLDTTPDAARPQHHFLRQAIEADLAAGTYAMRRWGGSPGDAAQHAVGTADPARVRTRFPPEPNGYLHIGHAKSIWLNFELARQYGGVCHLRYDDTNPEKERQEYVDAIGEAVRWLGYDTEFADAAPVGDTAAGTHSPDGERPASQPHVYFASDYFGFMYRAAVALVEAGHAYVDEQSAEEIRACRGDFNTPGTDSPFRSRTPAQNLERLHAMKTGALPDGAAVLRAKIDMASPNMNLRDPALYRIRRATHHNTGDAWCIYPMYTFAHPIEDALENITHSFCTLEFEDQRPFYDWLLERLAEHGLVNIPPPRQYEFARLNLSHTVTSKRRLRQLVDEGHVDGWDDPRLPTLAGLRRRGYTPAALRLFNERNGVTKSDGWIDHSQLEQALRDTLDPVAPRAMAVLDPVRFVITNWDALMGAGHLEPCSAPVHPHHPEMGTRHFHFGRELWIERSDYEAAPPKGFFRLFPGNRVRLKYGYVVECTGATAGADGRIDEVQATLVPDTKSGTPGADAVKVKGVITWVGASDAVQAEVRLYDRLFSAAQPGAGDADFLTQINPESLRTTHAVGEPSLRDAQPGVPVQLERHGYFVRDAAAGALVLNKATGLKDSFGR